jgi:hypothetical protein
MKTITKIKQKAKEYMREYYDGINITNNHVTVNQKMISKHRTKLIPSCPDNLQDLRKLLYFYILTGRAEFGSMHDHNN